MGSRFSRGFTIIEVMLFLAITGLLLAGILASTSNSLNQQHYRDGVEATRNKLSVQFTKVYSLTNDNTASGSGNEDPCGSGAPVSRGTSSCFYVGRLIRIEPDGQKSRLRISPVVAQPIAGAGQRFGSQQGAASATEGDLTTQYTIKRHDSNASLIEDDEIDWGLAAVSPGTNDMMAIELLVLRSPVNGTVQTYNLLAGESTAPNYTNLNDRINLSHMESVKFCLADLLGGIDPSERMAIIVHKAATTSSNVETRLNKEDGSPEC